MFNNQILSRLLGYEEEESTPQFSHYSEIDPNNIRSITKIIQLENSFNENSDKHENHEIDEQPDAKFMNSEHLFENSFRKVSEGSSNINETGELEKEQEEQNTNFEEGKEDNEEEDSNEFLHLKSHIVHIETIATQEINRLKEEVHDKNEQIGKLLDIIQSLKAQREFERSHEIKNRCYEESGMNTEDDLKNEEIKSLKEAVMRHIRINKELTKKLGIKGNTENRMGMINLAEKTGEVDRNK